MNNIFLHDLKHDLIAHGIDDEPFYGGCNRHHTIHTLNRYFDEYEMTEYFMNAEGVSKIADTVGEYCFHTIHSDYTMDITIDIHKMFDVLSKQHNIDVVGWFVFGSVTNQLNCPLMDDSSSDVDIMLITDSVPCDSKFMVKCFDIQTKTVEYFNTHNEGSDELISKVIHDKLNLGQYKTPHGIGEQYRTSRNFHFGDKLLIDVDLDLENYRRTISSKSSNSWVKARKKLTVKDDYDKVSSMKSLFHSLLLLHDGVRIARGSKEDGFSRFSYINTLWNMIRNTYNNTDEYILNEIQREFKPMYNDLKSQFRVACPKKDK